MRPEERHTTRITAKIRYAAEFFTSLYPPTKSRSFVSNLSQLQDHLGILNDIATNEKLLQKLIGSQTNKALSEARHIITNWNANNAKHSF